MREILQIIGCALAVIIVIVVNVSTILKFKSSNRDKIADAWFIEEIFRGAAFAILILVTFVLLSLLF